MKKIIKKLNKIPEIVSCAKCGFVPNVHGGFLEGVYEIELDTKTGYEGF